MPFLNLCSVIFKSKSKLARYEHIAGEVVSFEPSYIMMTDEQLVRRSDVLRNHAKDDAGGLSGFVATNALALIREHIRRHDDSIRPINKRIVVAALALYDGNVIPQMSPDDRMHAICMAAYLAFVNGLHTHIITLNGIADVSYYSRTERTLVPLGVTTEIMGRLVSHKEKYDVLYGNLGCDIRNFALAYLQDNLATDAKDKTPLRHDLAIVDDADVTLLTNACTRHKVTADDDRIIAWCTTHDYVNTYAKVSGLSNTTGTRESSEFRELYGIDTIDIKDDCKCIRQDLPPIMTASTQMKYERIADEVEKAHAHGEPVLVVTGTVANACRLSGILDRRHIEHEATSDPTQCRNIGSVLAYAGRYNHATIATVDDLDDVAMELPNGGHPVKMADRLAGDMEIKRVNEHMKDTGVDSKQSEEVPLPPDNEDHDWTATEQEGEAAKQQATRIYADEHGKVNTTGGLYVIHDNRSSDYRYENKMRAYAGQHGESGRYRCFVSMDDAFPQYILNSSVKMKRFADICEENDAWEPFMDTFNNVLNRYQSRLEKAYHDLTKNTIACTDVVAKQRAAVYAKRDALMNGQPPVDDDVITHVVSHMMDACATGATSDTWDVGKMHEWWTDVTGHDDDGSPIHDATGIAYGFARPVTRIEQEPLIRKELHDVCDASHDAIASVASNPNEAWDTARETCMIAIIDEVWSKYINVVDAHFPVDSQWVGCAKNTEASQSLAKQFAHTFDCMMKKVDDTYLHNVCNIKVSKATYAIPVTDED